MRGYDDYDDQSIRLYTPVLQRLIILGAVVIAVPILMWTITTFVRSYVARPKVPLLEHVASTTAPARIPLIAAPPSPASVPADQSATPRRTDGATASDGPDSSPSPAAATDLPTASLPTAPMQPPSPAIPAPPAAATGDAATASIVRLPQARPTDSAASSIASSADRGIAWPNPNTANPPDFGAPRLAPPPSPAPPSPPPARTAATEVLPADEPIRGPVPLPRQRPSIFAMVASNPVASSPAASGPAAGGAVPLPRTRPAGAPAEAASTFEMPAGARLDLESPR